MYLYRVYGRVIESNVEIPGFQQVESSQADLKITWPDHTARYSGIDDLDAIFSSHYHPAEGGSRPFALFKLDSRYVLSWKELCDFEVSDDGSTIICHPWPGASWGEANPFIQGRILPLALNFLGAVTLHGAAVLVDGGVAALLGTSGTGKSTLSASFHALGHPLVADDLVAVWQDGTQPVVEWGPNHVRLDENSLDFISGRLHGQMKTQADYDKTRVTLRSSRADATPGLPLRTIYLLERVGSERLAGPEITELPSVKALPTIMQSISNHSLLSKQRLTEQFGLITQMLNKVPVKYLRYPSDLDRLAEVCQTVNADL